MTHSIPGLSYEKAFIKAGLSAVAGLDEAGRGAWAGPVSAGAVILPPGKPKKLQRTFDGVRDSKMCTSDQRGRLYDLILAEARATGVGMASAEEIDEIGIMAATRLAMERALERLEVAASALLIDGRVRLAAVNLPQRSIVRGEQASLSIAAASILAKVDRDRLLIEKAEEYPDYGFDQHKGYGTPGHYRALQEFGPTPFHRHSFAPMRLTLLDGQLDT
jgi:ribonuclease HII